MTMAEFFKFEWLRDWFRKPKPVPATANDFELTETMWGYMAMLHPPVPSPTDPDSDPGEAQYLEDYAMGKKQGNKLAYEVTLRVDDFKAFIAPSGRRAPMTGWVSVPKTLGEKLPIANGEYGLYWIDPKTGGRRISYKFDFKGQDGRDYRFSGYKVIVHDKGEFDILEDQTTLFAKVETVEGSARQLVARGIIHYHVEDFPEMVLSMRTPSDDTPLNRMRMTAAFFSFVNREISDYFRAVKPTYEAAYTNLVISGRCQYGGEETDLFFFSGVHDKGFPMGDNAAFSDIGLVFRDRGRWRRFAITDHAIPGLTLQLHQGEYRFTGRLFEIEAGCQLSFSEIHGEAPSHHRQAAVEIDLRFTAQKITRKQLPFEMKLDRLKERHKKLWQELETSAVATELSKWRDINAALGYTSEIYRLTDTKGRLRIDGKELIPVTNRTSGEGENGIISSLRTPPLYYNYFCAVEPGADLFRVHIRCGVLKTLAQGALKTEIKEVMSDVVGQLVSMDLAVKENEPQSIDRALGDRLIDGDECLLEINNDHFPTATFQRRVVQLPGSEMQSVLALEENMHVLNLAPRRSQSTAKVAAVKRPDRFGALDEVLTLTGFFEGLEAARVASGKTKQGFSIVVKPSFSFMYSLSDRSTFTDPDLVEHLIDRISERGYENISLVEARSTYAVFFTNRDVPTLARYVGYKPRNYNIVDLSEGTEPFDYSRTLGRHEVHPTWRDADYRISFAKNKTHSYAYYTLTIKNIYGALPRENKFRDYHCNESLGIYHPTIDYLEAFPVHFGLIDGYISADDAFGIFADTEPNYTGTILGGDNLVAVDWVAASKMGYDPMVSPYMQLAVERFGKPKITFLGDPATYTDWKNVPGFISEAAHGIIDHNYVFGNFLYSIMATMDPFFQFKPDEVSRRVARLVTSPLRSALFERIKGDDKELTWDRLQKMLDPKEISYLNELMTSLLQS
ncbi:MAG: DUF362 domain-containing protein [Myxococcota bacterium]|nr:DUF362 domain-containing protein [Myxococcota bacterium]